MPKRFSSCEGVDRRFRQWGNAPSKFLEYLVVLCFERRCIKSNTVACLKSKYLAHPKYISLSIVHFVNSEKFVVSWTALAV